MVERLFLDRVDAEAARAAIAEQLDTACFRATYETQASLTVAQLAGARAHVALLTDVAHAVPEARVIDRARRRLCRYVFCRLAHMRNCAPIWQNLYCCRMRGA